MAGLYIPAIRLPDSILPFAGVAFVMLPVAFTYATLRHQLFDLKIIVRIGLQYALARGVIGAVAPITLLVLLGDVLTHRSETLENIVYERGFSYVFVLVMTLIVWTKREEWLTGIDRRFFRERYVAHQILKDVVEDVSASSSFDAAAQKVIGRIDSALHPAMVAVMTKPRTATAFSSVASSGHVVASTPANGQVPQVARAIGKPVTAGALGLDTPGIELVVPIATDPNHDEALLILGRRRSEDPYSKEDQDLLATIAASLRLLIGRSSPAEMPTVTHAAPARLLANRYRIEHPIGEGGMGMVFAATDETLQRSVAIKVIKDQHLAGDALARFQREARTAASLSHPHIVTVHDFGTDETGSPFLVMELLEGRSLRSAIKEGAMHVDRAMAILTGIASAIDVAHGRGVIHRDLKPENVFLVGGTHAKILDYGIAKAMESPVTFATPGVMGTLAYMAPEQASGGDASRAWDVWALSVIAFEMLTGQHPFGGGLPITTATPILTLAPQLNESLANAIDRALSLNPSNRPPTASQLIQTLQT